MEKKSENVQPDAATALSDTGNDYRNKRDYDKALEYFEQALEIRKKELGSDHPDTAIALDDIGNTYVSLGHYIKALAYHEQAFHIYNTISKPEDPKLLKMLDHFLDVCIRAKKNTKAYNVLNSYLKGLPKDHPEFDYLVSFKNKLDKDATKTGFRPPSAHNQTKKKKKRKKKK